MPRWSGEGGSAIECTASRPRLRGHHCGSLQPQERASQLNPHSASQTTDRWGARLGLSSWLDAEMPKPLTVDDILPLVACLTPQERVRLLRMISLPAGVDAAAYGSGAPSGGEPALTMPTSYTLNFDHIALAQGDRIGGVRCRQPSPR